MTCEDCTRAKTELWHGFRASCKGCIARAFSRSIDAFYVKTLGPMDAFDNAIKSSEITRKDIQKAAADDFINKADNSKGVE